VSYPFQHATNTISKLSIKERLHTESSMHTMENDNNNIPRKEEIKFEN